jgi:hypothetical protein
MVTGIIYMSAERNPNRKDAGVSTAVRILGRVLRDTLAELDREMARSESEREQSMLWRMRSNVCKVIKALIGHEK